MILTRTSIQERKRWRHSSQVHIDVATIPHKSGVKARVVDMPGGRPRVEGHPRDDIVVEARLSAEVENRESLVRGKRPRHTCTIQSGVVPSLAKREFDNRAVIQGDVG
jgi:hypothetical protein